VNGGVGGTTGGGTTGGEAVGGTTGGEAGGGAGITCVTNVCFKMAQLYVSVGVGWFLKELTALQVPVLRVLQRPFGAAGVLQTCPNWVSLPRGWHCPLLVTPAVTAVDTATDAGNVAIGFAEHNFPRLLVVGAAIVTVGAVLYPDPGFVMMTLDTSPVVDDDSVATAVA